jgi:hypothetical protein
MRNRHADPSSRRIPEHVFVILDVDHFQVMEKSVGLFNQQHRAIVLLKYKQGKLNIHVCILAEEQKRQNKRLIFVQICTQTSSFSGFGGFGRL